MTGEIVSKLIAFYVSVSIWFKDFHKKLVGGVIIKTEQYNSHILRTNTYVHIGKFASDLYFSPFFFF